MKIKSRSEYSINKNVRSTFNIIYVSRLHKSTFLISKLLRDNDLHPLTSWVSHIIYYHSAGTGSEMRSHFAINLRFFSNPVLLAKSIVNDNIHNLNNTYLHARQSSSTPAGIYYTQSTLNIQPAQSQYHLQLQCLRNN